MANVIETGDNIIMINGQDATTMTHKQAQDAIVASGDRVNLSVRRFNGSQEVPGVWKPSVGVVGDPATAPGSFGQTYTKTSLLANQPPPQEDTHWDVKHNITAKAFNPSEPVTGFKSVAAPITKPTIGPAPSGPPRLQVCWLCAKPIIGVFVQVQGRPTHAECFVCQKCKNPLKNVGHSLVGDSLFCHNCSLTNAGDHPTTISPQQNPPRPNMQNFGLKTASSKIGLCQEGAGNITPAQMVSNPVHFAPGFPSSNSDWDSRLNQNSAGMATNADDFTKQFMKQLGGGH